MSKVSSISPVRLEEVARTSRGAKQKEMLLVMTGLVFIEQHALLSRAQLSDAKRSIQAMFLRTTGEETMLRKLIDILRVNRDLHHAFSAISKIGIRIGTSVEVISKKIHYLKNYIARLNLTPAESNHFFSPFMSFTHAFLEKILTFNAKMRSYLDLKEDEARRLHEFRIAHEASDRLRKRLSGGLGADMRGEVESNIREEVLETFDYQESQQNVRDAQHASRIMGEEIAQLLQELKGMCEMAMNPEMRDDEARPEEDREDIFARFTAALNQHRRLRRIQDFVLDYFRLYQRAYGMFMLDFNNFNKAVETIANNSAEYFDARQEDQDIRVKIEKLKMIEGLIPFLDAAALALIAEELTPFQQFSRKMSETIGAGPSKWQHIREDLLVAKVSAEADLRTQIG